MSENIYKMYSAHCVPDAHNFNVTDHEKSEICMQIVERRSTANLSIHVRSCPEPFIECIRTRAAADVCCVMYARNCMQNEFYHYLLSCGNAVFVQSAQCTLVHTQFVFIVLCSTCALLNDERTHRKKSAHTHQTN